jgi:pimeloyl-ACP methyl ester carboxylesterase
LNQKENRKGPILVQEDHFVDSSDPGIRLHVLEKRRRGLRRAEPATTLLFVHGQSVPSPISFDLRIPGYSWMDFVAGRGFDVFALSIRGYGLSTRPRSLEENPLGKPPAVRGVLAVRDIDAAVHYICARKGLDRINLLGWSWGTTTTAAFTAANQTRVAKLVLYAPFYAFDDPARAARMENPDQPGRLDPDFGAWRWVTEKTQRARWDGSIPKGKHGLWREERVARAWWKAQLIYDPLGRRRQPPAVRVPNGPLADAYDRARNKPIYDASQIRCPVLLIRGDHDQSSQDPEVSGLFRALTATHRKRYVVIGDATHFLQYERRREELFREVQLFLEND